MSADYVPPKYKDDAFNCPNCDAYAHQTWYYPHRDVGGKRKGISYMLVTYCDRCQDYAVWVQQPQEQQGYWRIIYPVSSPAPMPNDDMPDKIKADYNEAREIVNASPRGAAALLRLALEKLIIHLNVGTKRQDIFERIGELVAEGIPDVIQKSLDAVRVIGNEAVHPGVIDLKDDVDTALTLFELLNWIVDDRITKIKKADEIYAKLPQSKIDGIKKRDGK